MNIKKAYCLFEQSGTFKNAFKSFGIEAEDFDILDEFGQTDYKMDLFSEIENAYDGKQSLFDDIRNDDVVIAFFPCTRFEAYNPANFQGKNPFHKQWTDEQHIENSMKLHEELHELYILLSKLFVIALRGGGVL